MDYNFYKFRIDRDFITKTLGFLFVFFGLLSITLNNYSCSGLCEICAKAELSNCFLLLLFVGITFLVNGAILVIFYPMYPDR